MAKIKVLIKSHGHLKKIFITARPFIIRLELRKSFTFLINIDLNRHEEFHEYLIKELPEQKNI